VLFQFSRSKSHSHSSNPDLRFERKIFCAAKKTTIPIRKPATKIRRINRSSWRTKENSKPKHHNQWDQEITNCPTSRSIRPIPKNRLKIRPHSNTRKLVKSESCRRRTNENTRRRKVQLKSCRRTNENTRRRKVQLKFPTRILAWDFHTRTTTAIVCS
jgi:hypothetical protein